MSAVQLDTMKTAFFRTFGRANECFDHALHLGGGHRTSTPFFIVRGAQRLHANNFLGAAHATVVKLDERKAVIFFDSIRELC